MKKKSLPVYLTAQERAELGEAARAADRKVSDYIRVSALRAARDSKAGADDNR